MSATQPRPLKSGESAARDWERLNDLGAIAADARNHASQLMYRERRPPMAMPERLHPFKIYQPPWEFKDGVNWSTAWRTFRVRAGRVNDVDATGTDADIDATPNADPDALYYPPGNVDIIVPAATAQFWFWLEVSADSPLTAIVRYGPDPAATQYPATGTALWTSTNPWALAPVPDGQHIPIAIVDTNTHGNELRAVVRQLLRSDCVKRGAQAAQVLALMPLFGRAPFMFIECGSGAWSADYSVSPDTFTESGLGQSWVDNIGDWLGGSGGDAPATDSCDEIGGYYLDLELTVTLSIDGGTATPVYHDIQRMSRYSGEIIYRSLTAWDASLNGLSSDAYALSDGGVESGGDKTMPWASSPHESVIQSLPILWAIPPGMGDTVGASGSASIAPDEAHCIQTSSGLLHGYTVDYHLQLTNRWGATEIQAELETLLAQINLSNPSQKYTLVGYDAGFRSLLSDGESITVTRVGPSAGVAKAIVLTSTGLWVFAPPQWMALNMNDVTYDWVMAPAPAGEGGVPGTIGDGDSLDAGYPNGHNWAMMKSMVQLPAGSDTKTIKTYQQPQKDTVGSAAYHATPSTPPNAYPGAELLSSVDFSVTGGNWYYFAPGPWISLTTMTAA